MKKHHLWFVGLALTLIGVGPCNIEKVRHRPEHPKWKHSANEVKPVSISSTTNRMDYVGNGAVDTYAYSFRIFDDSHLQVTVRSTDDEETTLVLDTDYTVTGVGSGSGGNVVLVDADQAWLDSDGDLLTDYVLTIRRVVPLTQTTDIRNQGEFFPETHEDAFDMQCMQNQQQQDQLDRSVRLPVTVDPDDVSGELPLPSAGLGLCWNAEEDGLTNCSELGGVGVSPYMETVLDDTSASAARSTLDAARLTSSLTAETSPAIDDYLHMVDTSESSAENKMTFENFFKVINLLTADTDPAVGDTVPTYDISASGPKYALVGALLAKGGGAGRSVNLCIGQGSDSSQVKITSCTGSALSSTNPAYVVLPSSSTVGQLSVFSVTSDVTLDLTGAHTGLDGFGNFTGVLWRIMAVNDTAAIKWMAIRRSGQSTILNTNTSATASNITTQQKGLVNSALNSGTWPMAQVGWLIADFTDASDEWALQNTVGTIGVGTVAPRITSQVVVNTPGAGAAGHGSDATNGDCTRRWTNAKVNTGTAILYADSSTLGGKFTANEAGIYQVSYRDYKSSGSACFGISVNASSGGTAIDSITASGIHSRICTPGSAAGAYATATIALAYGDVVRAQDDSTFDTATALGAEFNIALVRAEGD